MMQNDLTQILQRAIKGEKDATEALFALFKAQTLSPADQENVHVYLKLAVHESHYAIYLRGMLYEYGYGVNQDWVMSFLLMREAAAAGNAAAIYEVGRRYLEGLGIPQQYENALQWLTLAADSPHYQHEAMLALGRMYEQGLGVPIDQTQAEHWYRRAAEK